MNLRSNIDPGSIRIGNPELGPSLVAFTLRAVAALALRFGALALSVASFFPCCCWDDRDMVVFLCDGWVIGLPAILNSIFSPG